MSNEKFDKVKELINKLLNVTVENGATENEAIAATLKVQRILAKYDMELSEVTTDSKEGMTQMECETSNDIWRFGLARTIADNFCVEVYTRNNVLTFYGYKRHCDTAKEVFMALYNFGRKRASEIFKEFRNQGKRVTGIKNQFYIGFVAGVKSALEAQSRALMVITPPEVVDAFADFCSGVHMKNSRPQMSYRADEELYNRGVQEGRNAATRKEIEG